MLHRSVGVRFGERLVTALRLACIGDIHGRLDRLAAVAEQLRAFDVDGIVAVGDFAPGPFNKAAQAGGDPVGEALRILTAVCPHVVYVPGNHDIPHESPMNVDGRSMDWLGLRIHGIGGGGPRRFGFPYEWSEEELERDPPPACDLLLTHTPPFGTALDRTANGKHVGSQTIRRWALAADGLLVCGHIHESAGVDTVGNCLCYNTGSLGEPFGRAQLGIAERDGQTLQWTVHHYVVERPTDDREPVTR